MFLIVVPNEKSIKRHICLNNTALTLNISITNVWPDPFCHLFINVSTNNALKGLLV